jgi:chromosome segregation ATPase
MENDDVTVRVLIEIRDRLDQTNSRLDQTNSRLDHLREDLGQRIDQTNQRLEQTNDRITGLEIRMATEITAVAGAVHDVSRLLKERRDDQSQLHDRIGRVERDVDDLKKRVG